jgi:hypothetical protein
MSADEQQGFVIRDRRARSEGQAEEGSSSAAQASSAATGRPEAASAGEASQSQEPAHPVTFSSFTFSLGTSALMLMGEQLDPRQARVPVNLTQAKEIIDILSMLEGKTKGNLTSEEQAVLEDMLYALRMKYVDLVSGKQPAEQS